MYTSASLSLVALEFFVNLEEATAGAPLVAVSAEIPASVKVLELGTEELPPEWRVYPAPPSVQQIGTRWVAGGESAALAVPSVLVPVERNYLLNPAHRQFKKIVIHRADRFVFDPRMWKPGAMTSGHRSPGVR